MISRKTSLVLSECITKAFYKYYRASHGSSYSVDTEDLYDFLYEQEYDAWFCNLASKMKDSGKSQSEGTRKLKEFIMRLHTGESIASATPNSSWDARASLGQQYLRRLAQDMLIKIGVNDEKAHDLRRSLELDGYIFVDGKLLAPESEILDIVEEVGLLQNLYSTLQLTNPDTAFHHLSLSEEHYKNGKWEDSISNSRKFLECVLQETAANYSLNIIKKPIEGKIYSKPSSVRDYLYENKLLDLQEIKVVSSIYSLLSEKGGHPYMAQSDQARLLRHLALTISQFVMLRLQGSIAQAQPKTII